MQSSNAVKGLEVQQMQIEERRDQKNPFQVNTLWSRMTRGCGAIIQQEQNGKKKKIK